MEIYMDDFTTFGVNFEEAVMKIEKVLVKCQEHNLVFNSEKIFHSYVGRFSTWSFHISYKNRSGS